MACIWGHRGCRGIGNPPENSIAAFKAAMEQGAQGFELDVFLSRDRRLVVFHDTRLERMTNGKGVLTDHTYAELKRLRLKNADGTLSEQIIPTYEAVLDLVERSPKQNANEPFVVATEIKGSGIASSVASAIGRRLKQGWGMRQFQVSSFNLQSLREMRALEPSIPIGVLFKGLLNGKGSKYAIGEAALSRRLKAVRDLRPEAVNITYPSLTTRALGMIAETQAKPIAWTAGEAHPASLSKAARRAMARHLEMHAITLITDYPGEMLALLKEYEPT